LPGTAAPEGKPPLIPARHQFTPVQPAAPMSVRNFVAAQFSVVRSSSFGFVHDIASRWRREVHSFAMLFATSNRRASSLPAIETFCMPMTPAAPIEKTIIAARTSTAV